MTKYTLSTAGIITTVAVLLISLLPVSLFATSGTLNLTINTSLREEHFGNIVIAADNVRLDCNGNFVTGAGLGVGIDVEGRSGVQIRECKVRNFETGFRIQDSSSTTLTQNASIVNGRGFQVIDSPVTEFTQNLANNNTGTGFYISRSSDSTLTGNTASNNGVGFSIAFSQRMVVTDNNASGATGSCGFCFTSSGNNTVSGNTSTNNNNGFVLENFFSSSLTGNTANDNNFPGFKLNSSNGNVLTGNMAAGNTTGFDLFLSKNTVTGNTTINNRFGFRIDSRGTAPPQNLIAYNNIIDNDTQATDLFGDQDWHHPDLLEGNFWSSYNGADNGSGSGKHAIAGDGIGDTRIPHPGPDFDNYPLMASPDAPSADDDDYGTLEDTELNVPASGVLSGDTDPQSDPLTAVLASPASNGSVSLNADGSFSYNPDLNYCGVDSFTYTANDGVFDSTVATVSITVECEDDLPVAVDDVATVTMGDAATVIDVLDNDTDAEGDPIIIEETTQPANGAVVNHATHLTYQPGPDYCNDEAPKDSFTYTLTPGGSVANVAVTVRCVVKPEKIFHSGFESGTLEEGALCNSNEQCQSFACKSVLGSDNSVCAPSVDHCVRQDGSLVFTTDEQVCADGGVRACEAGEWALSECTVDAPVCVAGSCQVCQKDELRCLGLTSIVQCDATGDGWQILDQCESFGFPQTFCFSGSDVCSVIPSCEPFAIQGCAGNLAYQQCGISGELPLEIIDCGEGKVCAGSGECVDAPFSILLRNQPNDVFARDVVIGDVTGTPTIMTAYSAGSFVINDLKYHVLNPETVSFDLSGMVGTGRGVRIASAENLSNDGILATWYANKPPDNKDQIYSRWLNADGSESEAEALVADGRFPDAVALGANTGAIVWGVGTVGAYDAVGLILDPVNGNSNFTVGSGGTSNAVFPEAAPHAAGFIVTWTFNNNAVHAQCFSAAGTAILGSPLVVASGGGQQFSSVVAGTPGQGAIIVWEDVNTAIRAQRIGANCALSGSAIEVTTTHDRKAVAMWPSGRFVIAFEETETDAFGQTRQAIFTKEYSASGALEEITRVTPAGFDANDGLSVVAWGTSTFMVVWSSNRDEGLMARRFK